MTKRIGDNDKEGKGFAGLNSLLSDPGKEAESVLKTKPENKGTTNFGTTGSDKTKNKKSEDSSNHLPKQNTIDSKSKSLNWRLVGGICLAVALVAFLFVKEFKIGNTNSARAHSSVSDTNQHSKYQKPKTFKETPILSPVKETWTLHHVTANTLNVRTGPGSNYKVIDRLNKWDDVGVLNFSEGWAQVKYQGKTGWVFGQYLQKGRGETAYQGYCYQNAGSKPKSGEILTRKGPTGLGELKVSNQTQNVALVRLRQTNGSARYMMYVDPWSTELITKIGEGIYEVQIMYGNDFSRACKMFIQDPFVEVFDRKMIMEEIPQYGSIQYSKYSITLHKVVSGNATAKKVDLSAFRD